MPEDLFLPIKNAFVPLPLVTAGGGRKVGGRWEASVKKYLANRFSSNTDSVGPIPCFPAIEGGEQVSLGIFTFGGEMVPSSLENCFLAPLDSDDYTEFSRMHTVCFLASRQKRYADGRWRWVRYLVDSCRANLEAGRAPVSSKGTLCYDLVSHISSGRPHLFVASSLTSFIESFRKRKRSKSFPILPAAVLAVKKSPVRQAARDAWVLKLANRVEVVALRRRSGWLERLLMKEENSEISAGGLKEVVVVTREDIAEDGIDTRGNELLAKAGFPSKPYSLPRSEHELNPREFPGSQPVTWPYFAHHVSGRAGPWPGENEEEYLKRLSTGGERSRCDAFGALMEIVRTGVIRAGKGGVPPGAKAVCFTGLRISESRVLEKYDPARRRHLFYGCAVCIRREALAGVLRPALLVQGKIPDETPDAERYRYHVVRKSADFEREAEKEFRVMTDVNLGNLPRNNVFLVVDSQTDLALLSHLSRWAVVLKSRQVSWEKNRSGW